MDQQKNRKLRRLCAVVLACMLTLCVSAALGESKPLSGRTISVIGDSISTYIGWSDRLPITDESCTHRYGEPYYGMPGDDCHNTDLLVSDTWWHQAATELGAQILVSNAGNSTGLLHASYPADANWQQYLQDMLAYKTRPYHLGENGVSPDIVALYIGSNDVGRCSISDFGSVQDVDFDTLIQSTSSGYVYAEPVTVAEAYCIMLHKIAVTYPQAEIYCFAVVPNAGGTLANVNKRLAPCYPFNDMIRGVAKHYGAHMVELLDAFGLDPDGDGVAVQSDLDAFQACYNNDPHPNADGFDVITRAFVKSVKENSRYIAQVETTAGHMEYVHTDVHADGNTITRTAQGYLTPNGMSVDYASIAHMESGEEVSFSEKYVSLSTEDSYHAEGGRQRTTEKIAPAAAVEIPLTAGSSTSASAADTSVIVSGDPKTSWDDGVYNYTTTQVKATGSISARTVSTTVADNTLSAAYADMTAIVSDTNGTETNGMVVHDDFIQRPSGAADAPAVPNGYDYVYIGSDQYSRYYAAFAYTEPQSSMPNEQPAYSGSGLNTYVAAAHNRFTGKNYNLIIPRLYLESGVVEQSSIARWASLQQFTLSDRSGNLVTAYCADQLTNAHAGYGYNMFNLEDASYYDRATAAQIRTVALNGYWGADSGLGSMEQLRSLMRQSGQFTEAEIAALNDGIAMTATQYAIWSLSNRADNTIYLNAYYTEDWDFSYPAKAAEKADTDLIFKLCHFLTGLSATETAQPTAADTIINEKNFLTSASLKLTGKPDAAVNRDADDANDLYTADVSFQLAVAPVFSADDSLVMQLVSETGSVLATGRIAGALQPGEIQLTPDADGRYTFTGLRLTEGGQNIRFCLDGAQRLQRGAYLYLSELIDGQASQPMVGVGEGMHHVDVDMCLAFDLSVSDDLLCTEHVWRDEGVYPVHQPKTGDPSQLALWTAMCLLSLLGLCMGMRKEKKQ